MPIDRKEISVLIADDSTLARRALRLIFETHAEFRVVGEAATGRQAVEMAIALKPQIITMDLEMPEGNGLDAIEEIMAYAPTRIMVVTGVPRFAGLDASFEALSRGALELIPKTTAWPGTEEEQKTIIKLARRLAKVPVLCHPKAAREKRLVKRQRTRSETSRPKGSIIALGASTGGPSAIRSILAGLPTNLSVPVVVVQHLSDVFASAFVDWMSNRIDLAVSEALPGTQLMPGVVYLAVRGSHITVSSQGWIKACHDPPRKGHCPSVDVLFESVARAFGTRAVGILLTGMGRDGADGLRAISEAGGTTVAQDERTSTVFGMPQAAIEIGAAQHVIPCREIASFILKSTAQKNKRCGNMAM